MKDNLAICVNSSSVRSLKSSSATQEFILQKYLCKYVHMSSRMNVDYTIGYYDKIGNDPAKRKI